MRRLPADAAPASNDAADRHIVGHRLAGDRRDLLASKVDDESPVREGRPRHVIGKRLLHLADENVVAIGGRIGGIDESRFADGFGRSSRCVDKRELTGRQPGKQRRVGRTGQQVLIGAPLCFNAGRFLRDRTGRNARAFRHGPPARRGKMNQQTLAIRHP